MEQLREIITGLLHSQGLWNEYQINKLIEDWGIMVGRPLSEVTQARDFNRGRLRVMVQDPVWGHHLSLMKPKIIASLNARMGNCLVKEIYFQVGEIALGRPREQYTKGNEVEPSSVGKESPELGFKRSLDLLKKKLTMFR